MKRSLRSLVLLLSLATTGLAKEQPNIILLFTDDQQADSIGAWGNPHIETPHLDRLVEGGTSFRNAYCGGSFSAAVCVASRTMLMTGRHWPTIEDKGSWQGLTLLPEALAEAGYQPLGYFPLGEDCWLTEFYEPLQARLDDFRARHGSSELATTVAAAEEREIALYEQYRDYYSYGFYIARRLPDRD